MAEVLIATWDGGGNVPPAVHLARELRVRGHTVRFLGHESLREQLTQEDFAFSSYDGARPFVAAEPHSLARQLGVFSERSLGAATLAELRRRPVDVAVVDCMLLPVLWACQRVGVRVVSLEHLFDSYLRGPWARGPIGLLGRLKRLNPTRLWDAADLCLAATLPDLDPVPAGAGHLTQTGPLLDLPAGPHDLTAHQPGVLVSLSTYHFPGTEAAMQRILDATGELDARVVVTTGPAIEPASLRTGPSHELHAYVPHDELMPTTSLVIGHGGHATTMRALAHDLPLALMPMHPVLDQPVVAKAVAETGAGEVLAKKASPAEIRAVVERLLADGPHRRAAASLGARIRDLDGTRRAADLVEQTHGSSRCARAN